MTLVITAVEEIAAPPPPRDPLAIPDFLRRELDLPAFLPTPARRRARVALAQAAAQLARIEPTSSPAHPVRRNAAPPVRLLPPDVGPGGAAP